MPCTGRSAEIDAAQQSAGGTGKAKLPHGLTVHELKEMTKARLQAEAAEKHGIIEFNSNFLDPKRFFLEVDGHCSETRERTMSRDSAAFRDRAMSRDSAGLRDRAMSRDSAAGLIQGQFSNGHLSDSTSSIPSLVQVNASSRDPLGRAPQVSPLPPGFQSFAPMASGLHPMTNGSDGANGLIGGGREAWPQLSKAEAWETASVTSHNSTVVSDYLGSESAFSSGAGGVTLHTSDDLTGSGTRARAATYPHGTFPSELYSYESTPILSSASPSPGNSFFDTAVGGPNRRRACTMSPQSELIHENRQHFDRQLLGVSGYNTNSRNTQASGTPGNFLSGFSNILPNDSSLFGYTDAGLMGYGVGATPNRVRTSTDFASFEGGFRDSSANRMRTSSDFITAGNSGYLNMPGRLRSSSEVLYKEETGSYFNASGRFQMSSDNPIIGGTEGYVDATDRSRMPSDRMNASASALANRIRSSSDIVCDAGVIGGYADIANRPRAPSAPSLPLTSGASEDFYADRSSFAASFPSNRIGETPATTSDDDVFGFAHVSHGREGPVNNVNCSSGFKPLPSAIKRIPAPPGLSIDNELLSVGTSSGMNHGFSRGGKMDSVAEARASSTWIGSGCDYPSANLDFSHASQNLDDNLAHDFGSILSLSGVEDRLDRERSKTYPYDSRQSMDAYFTENFVTKDSEPFRY